MTAIALEAIPQIEILPGFKARMIHTDRTTTAFWEIEQGSVLPLHHHIHEQISIVTKGELELTVDGITHVLSPGQVLVIPSNVPHTGRALTDVEVTDVFSPVREDYAQWTT